MQFSYLIVLLSIVLLSTIGLLVSPVRKTFPVKTVTISLLPAAVFFIIWDMAVVNHFWYFAKDKTLPFRIGGLPLEEILFFLIVPYAISVIYCNVRLLLPQRFTIQKIHLVIAAILLFTGIGMYATWGVWYTFSLLMVTAAVFIGGVLLMQNNKGIPFATIPVLIATLFCTLIFNGLLTSLRIVTYNPDMILNWYVWTIPVEDFVYGLAMIQLFIVTYEQYAGKYEK